MPSPLLLALALFQDPAAAAAPLTIDDVVGGRRWSTSAPDVRWAWDREHLIVGRGDEEVWRDPVTWEEVAAVEMPEDEPGGPRVRLREGALELVPVDGEARALHAGAGCASRS